MLAIYSLGNYLTKIHLQWNVRRWRKKKSTLPGSEGLKTAYRTGSLKLKKYWNKNRMWHVVRPGDATSSSFSYLAEASGVRDKELDPLNDPEYENDVACAVVLQ